MPLPAIEKPITSSSTAMMTVFSFMSQVRRASSEAGSGEASHHCVRSIGLQPTSTDTSYAVGVCGSSASAGPSLTVNERFRRARDEVLGRLATSGASP